jgi:hypothetical protein
MVEYIDKNKAIELIKELENIKDVSEAEEWVDIFISTINELPIIELKHGQWIYDDEAYPGGNPYGHYNCDQCWESVPHKTNYCPNCGADMREEEE